MNNDDKKSAQDRCFQEQQFFTLSSVAFSGFFGGLQGRLGTFQLGVAIVWVAVVSLFATYLILERADYYRHLENHPPQNIFGIISAVCRERSSALYYCLLTLGTALGVIFLMIIR